MAELGSIADILDVHVIAGAAAAAGAPADLLIEVPHGAWGAEEFAAWAGRLVGPHPAGLRDFFYVNTDVGAFGLGMAAASQFVAHHPARTVIVVRCRIPRTFIDCNRVIDASAEDFVAGGVTPGLMPWIVEDADRALLLDAYRQYTERVAAVSAGLAADAAMVLLHTYSPRTVDVQVDADVVQNLRDAWAPDRVETWPLRPAFDVISRALDGTSYTPLAVVDVLRTQLGRQNWEVADSATYPMHPSTMAWTHVQRRPARTLCLEARRDLLVRRWDPFSAMEDDPARLAPIATALAEALGAWWPSDAAGATP